MTSGPVLDYPGWVKATERRLLRLERRRTGGSGGGATGPPGPPGPPGDPGLVAYTHTQGSPASVWTIDHPLPFVPNVAVVDSAGTQAEGEVEYLDADTVQITFSAAFSGKAYLS